MEKTRFTLYIDKKTAEKFRNYASSKKLKHGHLFEKMFELYDEIEKGEGKKDEININLRLKLE